MTITSHDEGLARLRSAGSAVVPYLKRTGWYPRELCVKVPSDLRQMREALDFVLRRPEWANGGWFWITDYVFDVPIFGLLGQVRAAMGEERELFDAPAHFFDPGEFSLVEPAVVVASYFEMDFFLVSRDERLIVFQTHDGFWDVACQDATVLEEFKSFFDALEGSGN